MGSPSRPVLSVADWVGQAALREWAYAHKYQTSDRRVAAPPTGSTDTTGIDPTPASNYKHP